jgi:hypothetical protein
MAEDAANAGSTGGPPERPPTSFGVFYPEKAIIAVIAAASDAERARQAVIGSGIPEERVHEFDSEFVLKRAEQAQADESVGDKVGRILTFFFSDTGRYEDEYLQEARKGSNFLLIQDLTEEEANGLSPILAANNCYIARYYGGSTVADLIIGRSNI